MPPPTANSYTGLPPAPPFTSIMQLCRSGVVLGKGTVLAKLKSSASGAFEFEIEGKKDRILALLTVANGGSALPALVKRIRAASLALSRGDAALCAIILAQAGAPSAFDEAGADVLDMAARSIDAGESTTSALKFYCSSLAARGSSELEKYDANQPRDDRGRWPSAGGAANGEPHENRTSANDDFVVSSVRSSENISAQRRNEPAIPETPLMAAVIQGLFPANDNFCTLASAIPLTVDGLLMTNCYYNCANRKSFVITWPGEKICAATSAP